MVMLSLGEIPNTRPQHQPLGTGPSCSTHLKVPQKQPHLLKFGSQFNRLYFSSPSNNGRINFKPVTEDVRVPRCTRWFRICCVLKLHSLSPGGRGGSRAVLRERTSE